MLVVELKTGQHYCRVAEMAMDHEGKEVDFSLMSLTMMTMAKMFVVAVLKRAEMGDFVVAAGWDHGS